MQKIICDLCSGDLSIEKHTGNKPGFMSLVEAWRAVPTWKFIGVEIIFPFATNRKELHLCSKCMTDFTEYVQRKSAYTGGDKK